MNTVEIKKIAINENGVINLTPAPIPTSDIFEFIYRAAMGVYWDKENNYFYPQTPKSWGPIDWYKQIKKAAIDELGIVLQPSDKTKWVNIPEAIKTEIINYETTKAT